jgi:hypothetical protein
MVSATGSGKTYTAASAALDCFRDGRILVMVRTLDLLVQTAQAWRTIDHRSPMVSVCSLDNDAVLEQLGVRSTTNPIQLALWVGSGPVVVFATYASLVDRDDPEDMTGQGRVRGSLETALAGGERLHGQQMDPFDLAVVDEAHGTAGDLGRTWAAIHDQQSIPADYRLDLTATPRILAVPRPQKGKDGQELEIASMSADPAAYGKWIYELGLSEAVERGVLAGFEIDVLEIKDPEPVLGLSEEALRGRRLALLQTALLEHAGQHNLLTVMTFHQRVEEAAAFAAKLPETAAELYATEVSDQDLQEAAALPPPSIDAEFYELEPHRHVPADRVWANRIGQHLANLRRRGGLGKDPEQAEDSAKELTAIDPDWNCPWPLDWQRHYCVLAEPPRRHAGGADRRERTAPPRCDTGRQVRIRGTAAGPSRSSGPCPDAGRCGVQGGLSPGATPP